MVPLTILSSFEMVSLISLISRPNPCYYQNTKIIYFPKSYQSMPKYLIFSRSSFLDGEMTFVRPSEDDIVYQAVFQESYRYFKDGVELFRKLKTLVDVHDYQIILQTKSRQERTIEVITYMQNACEVRKVDFPKITAFTAYDQDLYENIPPTKPKIVTDFAPGMIIIGYGSEEERDRACVRKAISAALKISESDRKNHLIIEDIPNIAKMAEDEGWKTRLLDKKFTLKQLVDELYEEESKKPSSLCNLTSNNSRSLKKKSSLKLGVSLSEIRRQDKDFEQLNKSVGQSTLFKRISTGEEWLGRPAGEDVVTSDKVSRRQKIASEIYESFGIEIPKVELSRQKTPMNNSVIYVMRKVDPEVKTYEELTGTKFSMNVLKSNKILDKDGKEFDLKGLGSILAMGVLINETEVIGAKGESLGFRKSDENEIIAVKTDFVDSFDNKDDVINKRMIKVSKDIEVSFDELSQKAKEEFLETLSDIGTHSELDFNILFERDGVGKAMAHLGPSIKDVVRWILMRQKTMLENYNSALEKSEFKSKPEPEQSKNSIELVKSEVIYSSNLIPE